MAAARTATARRIADAPAAERKYLWKGGGSPKLPSRLALDLPVGYLRVGAANFLRHTSDTPVRATKFSCANSLTDFTVISPTLQFVSRSLFAEPRLSNSIIPLHAG